jgi:glycosyltransferase involved in cell wall biosynthesis
MSQIKSYIFVSIDGMTDPLGQSQVIPYLAGLSKQGFQISIISCEKPENFNQNKQFVEQLLNEAEIKWYNCIYKTKFPLISQVQNYFNLKKLVSKKINHNVVLHCRSYLAGLIGLYFKQKLNTGFIFDMRGFWADERIDGAIWNKKIPIHNYLYSYFKKQEKIMLVKSDAVITLSNKAKKEILNWNLNISNEKITVIPCCVDLEHFCFSSINTNRQNDFKTKFKQLDNKFVLSYIGSLGTWYMAEEMLDFFNVLNNSVKAHFLIITKDNPEIILNIAKRKNISSNNFTIISSSRNDIPYYLALSDASIFFIRPSFSKIASSPTKLGEILSMNKAVITNNGIGDVDEVIDSGKCGVVLNDFSEKEYLLAINNLLNNRNLFEQNANKTANKHFSLNDAIEKYSMIYKKFIS